MKASDLLLNRDDLRAIDLELSEGRGAEGSKIPASTRDEDSGDRIPETACEEEAFFFGQFEIVIDHHLAEIFEADLGFPSQNCSRF